MPCEQKQTQNPKKCLKNFFALKTKQNTEITDEDSEFYYLERARNGREKS